MTKRKESKQRQKSSGSTNYRSRFEESVGLSLGVQSAPNVSHESEKISFSITLTRTYLPDFVIRWRKTKKTKAHDEECKCPGCARYLEAKGYFKASDRKKILAVIASNPGIDLRIIFQRDNYLTKAKSSRYSDWCEKNGIKFAVGRVPKEWLKRSG